MRVFPLALVLGSLFGSPVQAADAEDWLVRSSKAEQQQNFSGTFVYERNGSFSTHRISHQVSADGVVREHLVQLDGASQELTRVDGQPVCSPSESSSDTPSGEHWSGAVLDPKQLSKSYEVRLIGDSRVAGRPTVVLDVMPRDQHRYGFELNLDRDTALPLKSLMLNEKGQVLERFQYADMTIGGGASEVAVSGKDSSVSCGKPAGVEVLSKAPWHSDWLPPGFKLVSATRRPNTETGEPVSCLVYSDGLASFSVFLESLKGDGVVEDARSQLGPTVAVSKHMTSSEGNVMVTVVGEVPLGTAERVALSMRAGEAQTLQ